MFPQPEGGQTRKRCFLGGFPKCGNVSERLPQGSDILGNIVT